ncbi:MAG: 23S rRNA (uracil(1939)-C(5))-methyltransferase RlmD [Clostridia bacterium]|nr:23S rRNA (uracil(1939)-C(5))-methyltransferase RlmD [Clostridia bacterium]
MLLKKNEEYVVEIIDNGFKGEGIAKIENFTIFVDGAIKGEKIKIKILKVTSSHAFGKIIEIIKKSENRIEEDCSTYKKCGGCELRHIDYETTINMKKYSVENTLKKTLSRKDIEVNEVIKMDNPYFYRNKLQYPIGVDDNNNPVMGVYAQRSHKIIETNECRIQNKLCQNIAKDIFKFIKENNIKVYNEKTLTGSIRHIIVRIGIKTNEVLVTLVTNERKIEKEDLLVKYITEKYKEIKTIAKNINSKNTNVILGNKTEIIFGDGYIEDYIGKFKFKISPRSFYQVNPVQTEKLYSKAVEYASLTGEETIFDLYCGIGTIGIFASDNVKKIYGIETIKEAIDDAKENAKINAVNNSEFFVGDVEKVLPEFIKERNITADVIFIDPPRKGCDNTALETILNIEPKKIVYVSCNPASLARDLKTLEEKYKIEKLAICDMFPFTHHVECVTSLKLK